MAISKRIRVEIYEAANGEYAFRVTAGNGRIVLTPAETYRLRGGVRRAVASLMAAAEGASQSDDGLLFSVSSPLSTACHAELSAEQARWDARGRRG